MRFVAGSVLCVLLCACSGGGTNDSSELEALIGAQSPGDVAPVGGLSLVAAASSAPADGLSRTEIRAVVVNVPGAPLAGAEVAFTTAFGGFVEAAGAVSVSATTDASGTARVFLQAPDRPALTLVTAVIGGFAAEVEVRFVPGPAAPDQSSLTVNPAAIPADGVSETTVSVRLADANGNGVADGTSVQLVATAGTVISANPAPTASGRVEFTLRAPRTQGTADLTVAEVPGIGASITFGALSSGEPAGIRLSVASPEIAVQGVGQVEETQFTVQVVDASGDPIDERAYGDELLDNLRVGFATRPRGGEYITGVNGAGEVLRASGNDSIDVRTQGGGATLNLHSGRLPGAVELFVEVLVDSAGSPLTDDRVWASLPLAAIASGPPHSIVLTYPVQDAIEPDDGVYRLMGKAIVNDRWGNPVPDGTAIYLGVLDSVIASGQASVSGSTLDAADDFVGGTNFFVSYPQVVGGSVFAYPVGMEPPVLWNGIAFRNDDELPLGGSVARNDRPPRVVQQDDRVLLFDQVADVDKSRFVAEEPEEGTSLEVQTPYSPQASLEPKKYVAGASLLGAHILGTTERGNCAATTSGVTLTREGYADVILDYPANFRTLNVGCGVVPLIDTRHAPFGSAEVLVIAESAGEPGREPEDRDRAVAVSQDFCFGPLAGFDLEASPGNLSSPGVWDVGVYVEDGADVPVAFTPVGGAVEIGDVPEGGTLSILVGSCWTDEGATCVSRVSIDVGPSPVPGEYSATIHYEAGDGATTVGVKFTR